jgi:hypothetical protein
MKRISEGRLPPVLWLVAGILLLAGVAARADDDSDSDADEDSEIVVGCHLSIGEFGYEAINMCIRENRAAREEVLRYPAAAKRTVDRCSRRLQPAWVLVKRCIDADLAAATALEDYVPEHGSKVDACRYRLRGRGEVAVRECVERAIEAEKAAENR